MDFARYATHLETFVEVTRLGSFAAAARRRGVAVSSIVRRIDALEADLQTRLFVRSTRALTLTDAGERLLVRARDVIDRLIDVRSEIGALDETPGGVLRLSCLPTFGRLHVLPVVAQLLETWPGLAIELDLTERLSDPATERCDAAIRIGAQPDSGLIATRIGAQRWIVCASPDYLDRHGRPAHLEDVARHRRIGKARELPGLGWSRLPITGLEDKARVFRCDEFEAQRLAARAGLGLAMLPNWVVGDDIAGGHLIHLFDEPKDAAEPIHILRALPDAPPKLRVFIAAMREHFVLLH
ncbi:LysR family transcriptional regulator [Telmatospirillum siberiense]|uniref:LysR family transcriptional regulator n=1 Tax=Telmatospirillum siberiense TaxID=382514 RepID=A0A2N3PTX7_9PROT|nr:LysR family transcriptional regulator [Telmatospirillum siberiense]PKU23865.1 LysR family transcriptional regulator [Telmatospirillum siberiense]